MVANLPDKIRIGVVKVSVPGTKIELWDKDSYTTYLTNLPPADSWKITAANRYNGNPYQYLVDRIFGRLGFEAERSIGFFLARNPQPAGPEIAQFLRSLPPYVAEDIEQAGWHRTVHDIDSKILDAVRDPAMRSELMRALQVPSQAVVAALLAVRRQVFCRTAQYLRKRAG